MADHTEYEAVCGSLEKVSVRNTDPVITERGRKLLALCNAHELTPLNGLESFGKSFPSSFTCFTYNGQSVVDFALVPQKQIAFVSDFRVEDQISSDHRPLRVEMASVAIPAVDKMNARRRKSTRQSTVSATTDVFLSNPPAALYLQRSGADAVAQLLSLVNSAKSIFETNAKHESSSQNQTEYYSQLELQIALAKSEKTRAWKNLQQFELGTQHRARAQDNFAHWSRTFRKLLLPKEVDNSQRQ